MNNNLLHGLPYFPTTNEKINISFYKCSVLTTNLPPQLDSAEKNRHIALHVIPKYPDEMYWEDLKLLFEQLMNKQNEINTRNPEDKYTYESALQAKTFGLLTSAVIAYKSDIAKNFLLDIFNLPVDLSVPAWMNFRKRFIKWLRDGLTAIEDPQCMYLDIMKLCASDGKMTLRLLHRIMDYDKAIALSWISDLRSPIIVTEKEGEDRESEEDTTPSRLAWVLQQITENISPNQIDIICHYTINANYKTCVVTNPCAIKFKSDPRIEKALFYQIQTKKHGIIIQEAIKALLSFNDPEIDKKLEGIIADRKKEKSFDRQGECERLLEHKPRNYP